MMEESCDVVIIGGGVAGLYAAEVLSRDTHLTVAVLEAEDRFGGRVHTIRTPEGGVIELGAQWVHGKGKNPLWKYVLKNQIPVSPVANRDGEGVFLRTDGKEIPEDIYDDTFEFLEEVHEDLNKFAKADFAPETIPKSVRHHFDAEFNNWLQTKIDAGEDEETLAWRRQFFDWYMRWEEVDTGVNSLYDQSAVSWGEYIDYDDDVSFADGYYTVVESMLNNLSDKVKALNNHVVSNINWSSEISEVTCANGKRFICKIVLVTVSLGYLKAHHETLFTPGLPDRKQEALRAFSFGTIARIKLEFEKPFWDQDDPGIHILWTEKPCPLSDTWVRQVVGFDEILGQPNYLMAWVGGDASREMESLTDEEIGRDLYQLLEMVCAKRLPRLKNVIVTRWFSNPFHLGCYSYRSPKCDQAKIEIQDLVRPLVDNEDRPRVLFAGEATDMEHYGTVHGALASGEREARRIVDLTNSYGVNMRKQ